MSTWFITGASRGFGECFASARSKRSVTAHFRPTAAAGHRAPAPSAGTRGIDEEQLAVLGGTCTHALAQVPGEQVDGVPRERGERLPGIDGRDRPAFPSGTHRHTRRCSGRRDIDDVYVFGGERPSGDRGLRELPERLAQFAQRPEVRRTRSEVLSFEVEHECQPELGVGRVVDEFRRPPAPDAAGVDEIEAGPACPEAAGNGRRERIAQHVSLLV
jgi:hypothetical protein